MSVTVNSKSSAPVPLHGEARAFEERFPFMRPTLPDLKDVMEEYQSTYQNGILTNSGLVARLEAAVAERLGVKHCVAVSSCTSGLMMVLRALGLSGEVIVPSFTFFATGHAILWNRLTPVFANSELDTWNVSPSDIEGKITEKTSAILAASFSTLPTHLAAPIEGSPSVLSGMRRYFRSRRPSCWLRAKAGWSPPATPNLQQPCAPCAIMAISARTTPNGWA